MYNHNNLLEHTNMPYYINNATVKRYTKKRKSKAKNPKQEYTTTEVVTADLGKQSEFKHGQQVVIIAKEDYEDILEELTQKHDQNPQLQEDTTMDPQQNIGTGTNSITNQELHKQLLAMDNDRIQLEAVQRELDTYKSMAIDWNGQLLGIETILNRLIDEVMERTKEAYDMEIARTMKENQRALESLLANIEKVHQANLEEYHHHNIAIAEDITQTVEATNEQIRKTSTLQMILHKKDINLQVPTNDLMEPPANIKNLLLVDNAEVMEKLQSKPNFGNVNIAELKANLEYVPKLEDMTVKSNSKK